MWIVIKFDKKKLDYLKKDFKKKFSKELNYYIPKIIIQKYQKNALVKKEQNLLDDYMFCYHEDFKKTGSLNKLKFLRGLKYFLEGFYQSQEDIKNFINVCRNLENKRGYLSQNIFDLKINSNYKFSSGPFCEMIFKIIDLQKNKIKILLGNLNTTISKKEFLFKPI
ncbi:MAG: hypothetical protein CMJ01_04175 [Pelagibacteraceae bacterium]|nr:hypothetical protein [Pelagibacteraceae bacterium]|tara:strand:- start:15012 stop:15509 length:498 start_codon:yes stop_codon:yes gene_type:complete